MDRLEAKSRFVECVVLNACYSEPQPMAIAQRILYVIEDVISLIEPRSNFQKAFMTVWGRDFPMNRLANLEQQMKKLAQCVTS